MCHLSSESNCRATEGCAKFKSEGESVEIPYSAKFSRDKIFALQMLFLGLLIAIELWTYDSLC